MKNLTTILEMIPVEVNITQNNNYDKLLDSGNKNPYVYIDEDRGILKVFRTNKKNLETLLCVYDYGNLQSPFVSNFEAILFLNPDKDGKVIKALPLDHQKKIKESIFKSTSFNSNEEFIEVFNGIIDKVNWIQ